MLDCRKSDFTLPDGSHYLNGAYMSPLSRAVVAAGTHGVHRKAVPYEILPEHFFSECDEARRLFACLINAATPDQIAIVPSASYAFTTAAANTGIHRGQKVIIVGEEFPSNVYVWQRACEDSGARLETIQPTVEGPERAAAWNDAVVSAIDTDTAAVSLSHVHWSDGTLFDLDRIGARARAVGAAFIIDGAQSVGAIPFDVQHTKADVVVVPAYKWLTGPYSVGLAYFGPRYASGRPIEESWIIREGSDDFAGLTRYTDRYRGGAIRYDVGGTCDFILMPMLLAALRQVLDWQPKRIAAYSRELTRPFVAEAVAAGCEATPDAWRCDHIFGLRLPGTVDVRPLQQLLRASGIHVSARGTALRVSAHVYNDTADMAALKAALFKVIESR